MAAAILALWGVPAATAGGSHRSAHLDRALEAVGDRDYQKAHIHLRLALEAGGHDRNDTVLIYRLSGEVAAAFLSQSEAEEQFRRMLAIDPRADVAVNEVPLVAEPYDAARSFVTRENAAIHVDVGRAGSAVTLKIVADALGMVSSVRLLYRERRGISHRDRPLNGGDEVTIEVPNQLRATASVTVVDRFGNQLMDPVPAAPPPPDLEVAQAASSDDAPTSAVVMDDEAPSSGARRSLLGRWYTWGALSVASGATAAYFGGRARTRWAELDTVIDDSTTHTFAEAQALEQRGQRDALVSNIALGAAVTTAVISVALIVRGRRGSQPTQRLVPVATRDGAGVAIGGRF
jgi:hypothetical protein